MGTKDFFAKDTPKRPLSQLSRYRNALFEQRDLFVRHKILMDGNDNLTCIA